MLARTPKIQTHLRQPRRARRSTIGAVTLFLPASVAPTSNALERAAERADEETGWANAGGTCTVQYYNSWS
jgi:hypothetical protein